MAGHSSTARHNAVTCVITGDAVQEGNRKETE